MKAKQSENHSASTQPTVPSIGKDVLEGASEVMSQVATQPQVLAKQQFELLEAFSKTLTGQSALEPERGDRRFNDQTWDTNPLYRSMKQSYLAWQQGLDGWTAKLGLNTKNQERVRLVVDNLVQAMSPTNSLVGNPEALKKAYDTGGKSLLEGAKHLLGDMISNDGMPSQVDKTPFNLGENLAATPGKVVFRNEMLELIRYQPTTTKVYKRPLLMVPPQINKFYVYDISPGRSLAEYALSQGFQVFMVSWRNPTAEHRDWGFENYVKALEVATEVVCEVAKSEDLNILGSCSGGITVATLLGYLAAKGSTRINSLSLMVSVLDTGSTGNTALGLFAHREVLEIAKLNSGSRGVLEGRDLAKIFSWLRPNDLVWSYWVNNYLLGNKPPVFDLLYWNNDTTNLPAKLHADFLEMLDGNPLVEAGKLKIDGNPIDLKRVTCDAYVVGGSTDHITPWEACYRTVDLLGGKTRFTLSSSGHVQAIINPPGNPKSKFRTCDAPCKDSAEYLQKAEERAGTWWDHWQGWLAERSGAQIAAPKNLGTRKYRALTDAPGSYVKEGQG